MFLLVVALTHRWVPGGSWCNTDAAFLCYLSLRLSQHFAQINDRFFHSGRSVGPHRQGTQAGQHCECALRCREDLGTEFFPVCRDSPSAILALYTGRVHWPLQVLPGLQNILLSPLWPYGEQKVICAGFAEADMSGSIWEINSLPFVPVPNL